MAGLLDIINKRRLAEAYQQQAGNLTPTTPEEPPAYEELTRTPSAVDPEQSALQNRSVFGRQVEAGYYDVKSGLQNAMAATTQALGGDPVSLRRDAIESQRQADKVADPGVTTDLQDIDGPGKLGSFIFGHAARGLPMIGTMAATGGAGRALLGAPTLAGAAAGSMALNTGEIYGQGHEAVDQMAAAGQLTPEREAALRGNVLRDSAIGGAINAALDTGAFAYLFKMNPAAKGVMAKLISPSLPGHVRNTLLSEGGTEALQEYVSLVAQKHALERPELFGLTKDEAWRIANAGAAGASMAAPLAPIGHFGARGVDALDTTMDAVGGLVNRGATMAGQAKQAAGSFTQSVLDGDFEGMKQRIGGAVDSFKGYTGDLLTELRKNQRVAKLESWLDEKGDVVKAGFDAFTQAVGANTETGNIQDAYARYKGLLAQAIGQNGVDSSTLNALAAKGGAGLGAVVSAFNAKLPEIESTTGAVFNTAKGVAGEAVQGTSNFVQGARQGLDPNTPATVATDTPAMAAGRTAGVVAQDQGSALVAGTKAAARSFKVSVAEARANLRALAEEARSDGVKHSSAGKLSPAALALRQELLDATELDPKDIDGGTTWIAKRLESMLGSDEGRAEFDAFMARPRVQQLIVDTFDKTPDEFRALLTNHFDLLKDEAKQRTPKLEQQAELYNASSPLIDDISAEDSFDLNQQDTSDAINRLTEMDSLNEPGTDNPAMDPKAFASMLVTQKQLDKKNRGNAQVLVTRTTRDQKTGEPIGEPVTEAKQINFMNVATAWRDRTPSDGRVGVKRSKGRNLAEGLSALVSGWTEYDEQGNPVEVTVQPARKHTAPDGTESVLPREGMAAGEGLKAWLRGDSVVGYHGGEVMRFSDVEKDARANQPVSLEAAVDEYFKKVSGAAYAAEQAGRDVKTAVAEAKTKAADKVAKYAIDRLYDELSDLDPKYRQQAVDEAINFVLDPVDPESREARNVPPAIRYVDRRVIEANTSAFHTRLSQLDLGQLVQNYQKGEQATSFDNEKYRDEQAAMLGNETPLTEDYSGEHINYERTQEAGAASRTPPPPPAAATPVNAEATPARAAMGEDRFDNVLDAGPDPTRVTPGHGKIGAGTAPADLRAPWEGSEAARARPAKEADVMPAPTEQAPFTRVPDAVLPETANFPVPEQRAAPVKLEGTMQPPDVKGKVTRKPREAVQTFAQVRNQAMNHLKKLYARTPEDSPGRKILERAMNRVYGNDSLLAADIVKLGQEGLKPSDINAMLQRSWKKFGAGETGLKKAEPAAAPANGVKKSQYTSRSELVVEEVDDDGFGNRWGIKDAASGERLTMGGAEAHEDTGQYPTKAAAEADIAAYLARKSKAAQAGDTVDTTDPAVQQAVVKAVQDIAGQTTGVKFDAAQAHPGQYEAAKKLITMAASAAYPFSTAFHEAFHAVYANYLTPAQRKQLYQAFRAGPVRAQIRKLLEASPAAWEDAKNDSEELMAYGFQFWRNGQLRLGPDTETVFGKIADLLQKVWNWIKDEPSAVQLLEQIRDGVFADGPPSPAEIAAVKNARRFNGARQVLATTAKGMEKLYDSVLGVFDDRLREAGNPHLDWFAQQLYTQVGEKTKQRGLTQIVPEVTKKYLNKLAALQTADPEKFKAALEARAVDGAVDPALDAFINEMEQYLVAAGVKMGHVGNYLPMSWAGDKIAAKKKDFIALLTSHQADIDRLNAELKRRSGKSEAAPAQRDYDGAYDGADGADRDSIHADLEAHMQTLTAAQLKSAIKSRQQRLPSVDDADLADLMAYEIDELQAELAARGSKTEAPDPDAEKKAAKEKPFKPLTPEGIFDLMSKRGLQSTEYSGDTYDENGAPNADFTLSRVFGFLSNAERRPYVRDDLYGGLQRYVKQAVKRAEWARRFGDAGELWNQKLEQAEAFGVSPEERQLLQDYKDAIFGAKLHNMNPTLRSAIGAVTVWQNYRVLSLALLGSVVDPLGIGVRTGEWAEAGKAFKTVLSRLTEAGRKDHAAMEALGETIGAIESAGVADSLAELYGGASIEGTLHKANDKLFTWNGMNGLTRSVRIAALAAGTRFIVRNAKNGAQGTRHLAELGLKAGDVQVDANGQLVVDDKVAAALNRFVDESALRPNVGERTKWGADPTFALLYHLKQYVFSFNKVINKKIAHELIENDNPTPMLIAASYIPVMAGMSMARDLIYHGGELPAQKGFLSYLASGVDRSGLMGPSAFAADAATGLATGNLNSLVNLAGPSTDQVVGAVGAIANPMNTARFSDYVAESLPGGNLIGKL